jgi:NADPH-dependent ferric siderophore reductase
MKLGLPYSMVLSQVAGSARRLGSERWKAVKMTVSSEASPDRSGARSGGAPSGSGGGRGGRGGGTPISAMVQRTEQLSPSMVRIVVTGPELARFTANDYSDAYVKLVFLRPGVDYPRPLDLGVVRERFRSEDWPQQRTYTVRAWDPAALELTIDFVVHGDEGLAGPWARSARPGDELLIQGPGGGYRPDPTADWHLLVGDESALPAIAAALERLEATAIGHVLLEVDGAEAEQKLEGPAGVTVHWAHSTGRPLGVALVEAVTALPFPDGVVQAFVHGEAAVVKELRRLLKLERGIPMAQLSISGYWRHGATDEAWRAVKADWNREIEQAEAGAGS